MTASNDQYHFFVYIVKPNSVIAIKPSAAPQKQKKTFFLLHQKWMGDFNNMVKIEVVKMKNRKIAPKADQIFQTEIFKVINTT